MFALSGIPCRRRDAHFGRSASVAQHSSREMPHVSPHFFLRSRRCRTSKNGRADDTRKYAFTCSHYTQNISTISASHNWTFIETDSPVSQWNATPNRIPWRVIPCEMADWRKWICSCRTLPLCCAEQPNRHQRTQRIESEPNWSQNHSRFCLFPPISLYIIRIESNIWADGTRHCCAEIESAKPINIHTLSIWLESCPSYAILAKAPWMGERIQTSTLN